LALVDAIADLHRAEFVLGDGISNDQQQNGLSARLIFPRVRRRRQKPMAQALENDS